MERYMVCRRKFLGETRAFSLRSASLGQIVRYIHRVGDSNDVGWVEKSLAHIGVVRFATDLKLAGVLERRE